MTMDTGYLLLHKWVQVLQGLQQQQPTFQYNRGRERRWKEESVVTEKEKERETDGERK